MDRDNIIKEKDYIEATNKTPDEIDKELKTIKENDDILTEWPIA